MHGSSIISEISVLYEIALAAGGSLNFRENCRQFLKPLMTRKGISSSLVIVGDRPSGGEAQQPPALKVAYAFPEKLFPHDVVGRDQRAFAYADRSGCRLIKPGDFSAPWLADAFVHGAVFRLDGVGYLVLGSRSRGRAFDSIFVNQLEPVLAKFALSLQACLLYERSVELQRKLTDQMAFEKSLAEIAATFAQAPAAVSDVTVNWALGRLGAAANAGHSYIFLMSPDGITTSCSHEFCSPGITPQIANLQKLPTRNFPWFFSKLKDSEAVVIPSVADLPPDAVNEKNLLAIIGIVSVVVVPLISQGALMGFLGFSVEEKPRTWSDSEIALLKFAGDVFVGAFERRLLHARMEDEVRARTRELRDANDMLRQEISRRRLSEQNLFTREQAFKSLVENASEMIIRLDPRLTVLYANPAALRAIGQPSRRIINREAFKTAIPARLRAMLEDSVAAVVRSKKQLLTEFDLSTIDRPGFLQASFIPEFDSGNRVASILCVARDITELRRLEEELTRLDRLHVVGEVAASIGHEVRNPMTVVRGYLQRLGMKEELAGYHGHFQLMIEEIDRANSIITEFLSLARNKSINPQQADLNDVITSILPLLQAEAMIHSQIIERDLGDAPPVNIDPKEVRQMLINFARNAMDASRPGQTITIRTHVEGGDLVLSVTDQGCGIPHDLQARIGLPFTTSKDQGTGLGLAVCYSIAQRHNAKITFTSRSGETVFYVRFPLEPSA